MAFSVAREVPIDARRLADAFWPGPLTIVCQRARTLRPNWRGPTDRGAGFAESDRASARAGLGHPITATSANLSGEAPASSLDEARAWLGEKVKVYLEGGKFTASAPSAVIAVGGSGWKMIQSRSDFRRSNRGGSGERLNERTWQTDRAVQRADVQQTNCRRPGALVAAPPYDLIGAARQNQLYERSPYNVVRLEFGREADRYAAAEKTLAEWLAAGVLVARGASRDLSLHAELRPRGPAAASHRIHRARAARGIRSSGRIVPHERTFPAAKEDRLRLLTALQVNTSLNLRAVLGRASRDRCVCATGRFARAADRSCRRSWNSQRVEGDRSARRNRHHPA